MGSHSVTCHSPEVTFQPFPQPIKAGTGFSRPRGMRDWVDLVGLVTYQGGITAQRRSPIPVLTGLNAEQFRSCDERRYHNAKPSTKAASRGLSALADRPILVIIEYLNLCEFYVRKFICERKICINSAIWWCFETTDHTVYQILSLSSKNTVRPTLSAVP